MGRTSARGVHGMGNQLGPEIFLKLAAKKLFLFFSNVITKFLEVLFYTGNTILGIKRYVNYDFRMERIP